MNQDQNFIGEAVRVSKFVDCHDAERKSDLSHSGDQVVASGTTASIIGSNKMVSKSWLKSASKQLNISSDIEDYVVVPVPTIITEVPNRNGVGFPASELVRFQTIFGTMAYQTWLGKPLFYEHSNDDASKAKGIILDTSLKPLRGYPGFFKLTKLLAWDRTKDKDLVKRIVKGDINTYSMGAYVGHYSCSHCGAITHDKDKAGCQHIRPNDINFYVLDGKMVYLLAHDVVGFETSAVEVPAYVGAFSDFVDAMDQ